MIPLFANYFVLTRFVSALITAFTD